MDKISIVIRNRNESEYIGFSLQSIREFFKEAEVIIIDNESDDDSLSIVQLFSKDLNIKIVTLPRNKYSPGTSINLGVKHASNDIVLVLSAHCRLTSFIDVNYINDMLESNVAVFGNQIPVYKGKKITKRYIWDHFGDQPVVNMFSSIENRYFLHNAFCFYSKEILITHPFDESYSGKEDRFWAIEMVGKGYQYIYLPSIAVEHFWTGNGATWKGLG